LNPKFGVKGARDNNASREEFRVVTPLQKK